MFVLDSDSILRHVFLGEKADTATAEGAAETSFPTDDDVTAQAVDSDNEAEVNASDESTTEGADADAEVCVSVHRVDETGLQSVLCTLQGPHPDDIEYMQRQLEVQRQLDHISTRLHYKEKLFRESEVSFEQYKAQTAKFEAETKEKEEEIARLQSKVGTVRFTSMRR